MCEGVVFEGSAKCFVGKEFGFVTPEKGGDVIFCHVRDNPELERCQPGDKVTIVFEYDAGTGKCRGTHLSKKGERCHRESATSTAIATAQYCGRHPSAVAKASRASRNGNHDDGGFSDAIVALGRTKLPVLVRVGNWLHCDLRGSSSGIYALHYIRWAMPLRCTSQVMKTIVDSWPVVLRTRSLLAASLNDPHRRVEVLNRAIGESNDVVKIVDKLRRFHGERMLVARRRSRSSIVGVTLGMLHRYDQSFCRLWERSEGACASMSRRRCARVFCHVLSKGRKGILPWIRRALSEPRIMMYQVRAADNAKVHRF